MLHVHSLILHFLFPFPMWTFHDDSGPHTLHVSSTHCQVIHKCNSLSFEYHLIWLSDPSLKLCVLINIKVNIYTFFFFFFNIMHFSLLGSLQEMVPSLNLGSISKSKLLRQRNTMTTDIGRQKHLFLSLPRQWKWETNPMS